MPLKIYCNAGLTPPAVELLHAGLARLGGHELVLPTTFGGSNLLEGPSDPALLSADVAFGQPNVADLLQAQRLRLIQLTSAGWARYERADLKAALLARGAVLCNASTVYADPCAQQVVGFMLAHVRQLAPAWLGAARRWDAAPLRRASTLLTGQSAVLVGYGAIAARVAELLAPYRMTLTALRRTPRGDERVPTFPLAEADRPLAASDHIVNILPGTAETQHFFDARRLGCCKAGAAFYNVGRGTTVEQSALAAALESGALSAAYLDVTDPEPLQADHFLWSAKNCYITPHTAGGYQAEFEVQVQCFLTNLERFLAGQPLVDRVV
jgi:phosphoglycerate dehydrogenase-like enzyme